MTQGSIAPLRFILPAQLIDLGLSSAHELLNEFWRHQALPEAIEDDPFKCGTAEALTVGADAAAACSGAGPTTRLPQSLAERRTKDYPLCRIGDRGCYVDRSNPNLFVMTYAPILSITIS